METVIPTAHCLCWTGAFAEAVARDARSGIIAALNGYRPEHVVNPAAKAHERVKAWARGPESAMADKLYRRSGHRNRRRLSCCGDGRRHGGRPWFRLLRRA